MAENIFIYNMKINTYFYVQKLVKVFRRSAHDWCHLCPPHDHLLPQLALRNLPGLARLLQTEQGTRGSLATAPGAGSTLPGRRGMLRDELLNRPS